MYLIADMLIRPLQVDMGPNLHRKLDDVMSRRTSILSVSDCQGVEVHVNCVKMACNSGLVFSGSIIQLVLLIKKIHSQ